MATTRSGGRHPLDDRPAERLGAGAGVDRDVDRPERPARVDHRADEPHPAGQAPTSRLGLQLFHRPLRPDRSINRPADDVEPRGPIGRDPRDGVEEDVMPLPSGEGRHQADPDRPGGGGRPSAGPIEPRAVARPGGEPTDVDGVVDRPDREPRAEDAPGVLQDRSRDRHGGRRPAVGPPGGVGPSPAEGRGSRAGARRPARPGGRPGRRAGGPSCHWSGSGRAVRSGTAAGASNRTPRPRAPRRPSSRAARGPRRPSRPAPPTPRASARPDIGRPAPRRPIAKGRPPPGPRRAASRAGPGSSPRAGRAGTSRRRRSSRPG